MGKSRSAKGTAFKKIKKMFDGSNRKAKRKTNKIQADIRRKNKK